MPLILKIAATHLVSRARPTIMSLLGIALGVAFFVAASALMRGAEGDFISRLIDSAAHITVTDEFRTASEQPAAAAYPQGAVGLHGVKPRTETRGVRGYKQKLALIEELPGVRVAPLQSGQAILSSVGREFTVTLNGVVPEKMPGVSDLEKKIVAGSLQALAANWNGIIIGRPLAKKLYVKMGDNVTVTSSTGLVRILKLVGLFEIGSTTADEGQAFVRLKQAQVLLGRTDRANKLIMQLDNPYLAQEMAALIESRVGYRTQSWQEASENLMSVLLIQNATMYSVVTAILVVAAFGIFNVISTIVMEKRRDIAILKSIGFQARDIQRIFLLEGTAIGVSGSVVGIALGYGLMAMLAAIKIQPPGSSQLLNLPLYRGFDQILLAAAFAILSAVGAAYLPAHRAGSVHPVDILRGGMA